MELYSFIDISICPSCNAEMSVKPSPRLLTLDIKSVLREKMNPGVIKPAKFPSTSYIKYFMMLS
jgi:hypothetical protein